MTISWSSSRTRSSFPVALSTGHISIRAFAFASNVGVSYGSDPRVVEKILLEVAEANPNSAQKPRARG